MPGSLSGCRDCGSRTGFDNLTRSRQGVVWLERLNVRRYRIPGIGKPWDFTVGPVRNDTGWIADTPSGRRYATLRPNLDARRVLKWQAMANHRSKLLASQSLKQSLSSFRRIIRENFDLRKICHVRRCVDIIENDNLTKVTERTEMAKHPLS